MSNRTGVYAALALAGAGGYYLYRAGGDPEVAKREMKHDAHVAREQIPSQQEAQKQGEKVKEEADSKVGELTKNARSSAQSAEERAKGATQESIDKLDALRQDASSSVRSNVDKFDNAVEKKAAEAKGSLSGWFGGGK